MSQSPTIAIIILLRSNLRGSLSLTKTAKLIKTIRLLEGRVCNRGCVGGLENLPCLVVAVEIEQCDELGVECPWMGFGGGEDLVAVLEDERVVGV